MTINWHYPVDHSKLIEDSRLPITSLLVGFPVKANEPRFFPLIKEFPIDPKNVYNVRCRVCGIIHDLNDRIRVRWFIGIDWASSEKLVPARIINTDNWFDNTRYDLKMRW